MVEAGVLVSPRKPSRKTIPKSGRRKAPKAARKTPAKRSPRAAAKSARLPSTAPRLLTVPKPAAARAVKPRLAAPPPLSWTQGGPRMRSARATGGAYVLMSHDGVDWTADWRPSKGRPTSVLFRRPLEDCVTACDRDHVLRFTNEVLARSGSEALAAPDLQGDAVAWKRRRF